MTVPLAMSPMRSDGERPRFWRDTRVWFVNCVVLEAAWATEIEQHELPEIRRHRDRILAEFIAAW